MKKYTYYKKLESEEEMLFDTEIARKYKLYRVKNTNEDMKNVLNPKLVAAIIEDYIQDNNIEFEELYYPTFSGISKVYPEYIYKPAIENFLEKQYTDQEEKYYKSKSGAKYKFSWSAD